MKSEGIAFDDHLAEQVNEMAKKFYSDPKNMEAFERWHLEKYGCLPDEQQPSNKK